MCSLLLTASSLLVAACGEDETTSSGGPSQSVSVTVEPAQAQAGDTILASVVNDSDRMVTYGAGYRLEREEDGGFVAVELPPEAIPEIGYVAPVGESGPPVEVKLPEDLEPGSYRVLISDVLIGDFEVTDG